MKKYFRTFSGYMREEDVMRENTLRLMKPKRTQGEYDLMPPGPEIVYSKTKDFNQFCGCCGHHYDEKPLYLSSSWQDTFFEAAEFASEYPEIGFVTFFNDKDNITSIVTECTSFHAYLGYADVKSFLVFFNARPSRVNSYTNNVLVGRDQYSFNFEPGSIIVWDFCKYACLPLGDYKIWGIRHGLKNTVSRTDDELVGLYKGDLLHVT